MRLSRPASLSAVVAVAAAVAAFLPGAAGAVAVEAGYCDPLVTQGFVSYPDGSVDITNQLSGAEMDAGCVTTHHLAGVEAHFVAAYTYPGWSYKVKDAGGKGQKVVVAFTHTSGVKITYTIQPGRLDWKVS